jgi:hypothetical protein
MAAIQPQAFQSCFEKWIAAIKSEIAETAPDEPVEREIIAVDGKTLRRSHDRRKNHGPLPLVSSWSVQFGISLGQLAKDTKSNEIAAILALFDKISVKEAIVTMRCCWLPEGDRKKDHQLSRSLCSGAQREPRESAFGSRVL